MPLAGFATPEGTTRYRARTPAHPSHWRDMQGATASSIGLGTYLGDPNDETDARYAEAITAALSSGCNVLDAAANYRAQRSERTIGRTLERLAQDGVIRRDEVLLCTKGGYLPFDAEIPDDPQRYILETFLQTGLIHYEELVAGCHCLAPSYLEDQLAKSLRNLRAKTIDVYYLHNPEQQLDAVARDVFLQRIEAAFAWLEGRVADGAIRWYGTATWNGYRINPQAKGALSLAELAHLAERVGGTGHHFRVVQAPYNLAMPEAYAFKNQTSRSLIEAAQALKISVMASASLLQTQLARLPAALQRLIPELKTDAQRAIQFVRSTPGITTALVGMKRAEHVAENLELAAHPTLSREQLDQLFAKPQRAA